MTCIVGISLNGEVWIGGDSAGTNVSSQQTMYVGEKVFFTQNEADLFLFGCTTSFRMTDLLRYVFRPPCYDGGDLHRSMVAFFIEAVRECLKAGGFAKKEDEREEGGSFLVGFRGRLFHVAEDYHIEEATCGYASIGSADDLALGVLFATHGQNEPEARLTLALQAAAYHHGDVRAPFVIRHLPPVAVSPLLSETLKQPRMLVRLGEHTMHNAPFSCQARSPHSSDVLSLGKEQHRASD